MVFNRQARNLPGALINCLLQSRFISNKHKYNSSAFLRAINGRFFINTSTGHSLIAGVGYLKNGTFEVRTATAIGRSAAGVFEYPPLTSADFKRFVLACNEEGVNPDYVYMTVGDALALHEDVNKCALEWGGYTHE